MVDATNPPSPEESPIPCTVGLLTFNSEATLERALQSVEEFDELLVCDGGSTDRTREIAARFGCRVIDQDRRYKDANNRLIDISGCRNQMVASAASPWVLMLDSDEYVSPELVAEIRGAMGADDGSIDAYHVPRKYVLDGDVVDCSIAYPRAPLRMVRVASGVEYHGLAHALPRFPVSGRTARLSGIQYVPFPNLRDHWRKRLSYLRMEEVQNADLTPSEWRERILIPSLKTIRLFGRRYYRLRRDCQGRRLPLRHELGYVLYHILLPWYTGRRFVRGRRPDIEKAWR